MKRLIIFILMLVIPGCGQNNETTETRPEIEIRNHLFVSEQTYVHERFSSQEECENAQIPGFYINCQQWITFDPAGDATIIATDIVWQATYTINKNVITVLVEPNPETPETLNYTLSSNNTIMTDMVTAVEWILNEE